MLTKTITITATGTWTAPDGVYSAKVECWGPGASGAVPFLNGGSGGSGGAYAKVNAMKVTPQHTYTVTVGIANPALHTTSVIGDSQTCLAVGGVQNLLDGVDNPGGAASDSTGDIKFSGGIGRGGAVSGSGGGGGEGAGTTQNGGNASGSTGGSGTDGGDGGNGGAGGGNGTEGTITGGGGGGGGFPAGFGNLGARGQVVITYTLPAPNFMVINDAVN
jgi:hypothetical protein